MLNVPPPVWSLAYVLIATVLSYLAGWPRVPGLPLVSLAVLLVVSDQHLHQCSLPLPKGPRLFKWKLGSGQPTIK